MAVSKFFLNKYANSDLCLIDTDTNEKYKYIGCVGSELWVICSNGDKMVFDIDNNKLKMLLVPMCDINNIVVVNEDLKAMRFLDFLTDNLSDLKYGVTEKESESNVIKRLMFYYYDRYEATLEMNEIIFLIDSLLIKKLDIYNLIDSGKAIAIKLNK